MAVIVLVAIFLVAVREPTDWWASVAFTGASVWLGVAALEAAFRRGTARTFWAGACLFGWGYWAMAFAPGLEVSTRPRLASSLVLEILGLMTLGPTSKVRAESFEEAGHSMLVVFSSIAGGLIALRIAARADGPRGSDSTREGKFVGH
jgi:hypothetical protein